MGARRRNNPRAGQEVFTTGEAARICRVSQQTIIRCFDSGRLDGFKVPGSRFRRIPRAELIRFMKLNGIPLTALGSAAQRVVVVSSDQVVHDALAGSDARGIDVVAAASLFEAGLLCGQGAPALVVLDLDMDGLDAADVVHRIAATPALGGTRVLVVGSQSGATAPGDFPEHDRVVARARKPIDRASLLGRVAAALESD